MPSYPTHWERRQQYEAAADEWDALPDVHCAPAGQQLSADDQPRQPPATACLEFTDVWAYFREKDLSAHMVRLHLHLRWLHLRWKIFTVSWY